MIGGVYFGDTRRVGNSVTVSNLRAKVCPNVSWIKLEFSITFILLVLQLKAEIFFTLCNVDLHRKECFYLFRKMIKYYERSEVLC